VTARLLDGRRVAIEIRRETAEGVATLQAKTGVTPRLAIVLVGDDPASRVYTRGKAKASNEVGMAGELIPLPADTPESELIALIARLNADRSVHGILVQLPLPPQIRPEVVQRALDPAKDVDGFHPVNAGLLLTGGAGSDSGFLPCTPAGILELLRRHQVPMAGRHAVVVGRSNIVGKPVSLLLLRENATVTICHSRTPDLESVTSRADILVCAIGRKAFLRGRHIQPRAVVVDVGMNRCEDLEEARDLFAGDPARLREVREKGSTLVGDVHPAEAMERAEWFTPVPGGVGPMTVALVLSNTLRAARNQTQAGSAGPAR
jgi:methylenetetrahydrofolate dehydrogenase (NADP+)/methenyltetrahydrofolate cyclohydrolase